MIVAHIPKRVVILQRESDSGAHINNSGNTAERVMRVQRAKRVIKLQRVCDGVAYINESGDTVERL